jgi:hypothetical protein
LLIRSTRRRVPFPRRRICALTWNIYINIVNRTLYPLYFYDSSFLQFFDLFDKK